MYFVQILFHIISATVWRRVLKFWLMFCYKGQRMSNSKNIDDPHDPILCAYVLILHGFVFKCVDEISV